MSNRIIVDHDEIATVAARIRDNVADISTIKESLHTMLSIMVTEASINTGSPAPVFGPILSAAQEVVARLEGALDIIGSRLEEGAANIEKASEEARAIGEDSAGRVNSIDTTTSSGSSSGSGSGSSVMSGPSTGDLMGGATTDSGSGNNSGSGSGTSGSDNTNSGSDNANSGSGNTSGTSGSNNTAARATEGKSAVHNGSNFGQAKDGGVYSA